MGSTDRKDMRTRKRRPRIVTNAAVASTKCTCGTKIKPGGAAYTVTELPNPLEFIFRDRSFCSPKCIRSFCLESLETLDAIDVPSSRRMVADLHELTVEVATTLVTLL